MASTTPAELLPGTRALYPALQRLTLSGYANAEWGVSDNNRRVRYCTRTPAGRKQLAAEEPEFERVVTAIRRVLEFASGLGNQPCASPAD